MFSDPAKNVSQFGLKAGATVADFGSGSGHYALAAGKAVGGQGKIYAIDIQKETLSRLKNEADRAKLFHVEVIWGDIEKEQGTHLADGSVDAVIISNLMFQVTDKTAVAKEAFRVLRSGGNLFLVDWSDSFGGIGPHPGSVFTAQQAEALFSESGLTVEGRIEAGEHHYGLIFRK